MTACLYCCLSHPRYKIASFVHQIVLSLWSVRLYHIIMYFVTNGTVFFKKNHSFYLWLLLPTHCRCRPSLLHLITLSDTHTHGGPPLGEWSAHRRDLYLTTHNTHNRQTPMPPVGFEPTIPASDRPQTHALDRAATWISGEKKIYWT